MVVFALSNGHKLGLGLVGLAVVSFALVVSMVIPRRRPDFPGRHVGGFVALSLCFFAAMLAAVFFFGRESHAGAEAAGGAEATTSAPARTAAATTNEAATTTGATTTSGATTTQATTTTEATTTQGSSADLAAGKQVFSANCAACHTLADASANGTVGPNLDQLRPDQATVEHQVVNGGGAMPAFKGTLTPEQITNVAAYVSTVAGKSS